MGRATVKDVAVRAGVSPKTVSNVMNAHLPGLTRHPGAGRAGDGRARLRPELLRPRAANGRTGMIALALPELNTAYSAEIAHHFVNQPGRKGWAIQIEETKGGPAPEHELMLKGRAHLVDGLILNPVSLETSAIQPGVALPPVVVIGEVDQPIADHVWIDNVAAHGGDGGAPRRHGRRRIAAIGVMESESARLRVGATARVSPAAGLPYDPELEVVTTAGDRAAPTVRRRPAASGRRTWTRCAASPTPWRWVPCTPCRHRSPGAERHRGRRATTTCGSPPTSCRRSPPSGPTRPSSPARRSTCWRADRRSEPTAGDGDSPVHARRPGQHLTAPRTGDGAGARASARCARVLHPAVTSL